MKPSKDWRFSSPLCHVNVYRIVSEAGPNAKCVRFTIGGKVYTAVNSRLASIMPEKNPEGLVTKSAYVCRDIYNDVFVGLSILGDAPWKLYLGDVTGEVMDRVKVVVEVFE